MTLDQIITLYSKSPIEAKMRMFKYAFEAVLRNCEYGNANPVNGECDFDLTTINYSNFCDVLGWPDFQDGGIFEQVIDEACTTVCSLYGYKAKYHDRCLAPRHRRPR